LPFPPVARSPLLGIPPVRSHERHPSRPTAPIVVRVVDLGEIILDIALHWQLTSPRIAQGRHDYLRPYWHSTYISPILPPGHNIYYGRCGKRAGGLPGFSISSRSIRLGWHWSHWCSTHDPVRSTSPEVVDPLLVVSNGSASRPIRSSSADTTATTRFCAVNDYHPTGSFDACTSTSLRRSGLQGREQAAAAARHLASSWL